MRIAVFIGPKGRGSNMRAIVDACRHGRLHADVAAVYCSNPDSPAIQNLEIPVRDPLNPNLLEDLRNLQVDLICLAGYLRLLPSEVVHSFSGAILNIHPALLPKFGGKGMYGVRVHEAVLAAGEKESGCTVHLVTENYDEGQIVLQKKCPVLTGDTPESLAERILPLEHEAYVEAIQNWIGAHQSARNASL